QLELNLQRGRVNGVRQRSDDLGGPVGARLGGLARAAGAELDLQLVAAVQCAFPRGGTLERGEGPLAAPAYAQRPAGSLELAVGGVVVTIDMAGDLRLRQLEPALAESGAQLGQAGHVLLGGRELQLPLDVHSRV